MSNNKKIFNSKQRKNVIDEIEKDYLLNGQENKNKDIKSKDKNSKNEKAEPSLIKPDSLDVSKQDKKSDESLNLENKENEKPSLLKTKLNKESSSENEDLRTMFKSTEVEDEILKNKRNKNSLKIDPVKVSDKNETLLSKEPKSEIPINSLSESVKPEPAVEPDIKIVLEKSGSSNINVELIKEPDKPTAQIQLTDQKETKVSTIPKFKDAIQKNFNLTKYGKMETNLSWLKILAILLVVLTHTIQSPLGWASNNGGSIEALYPIIGNNAYYLHFFQILSIPCVNIFVVISCFLENKPLKIKFYKLIKLYLQITFILLMMTVFKWIVWPTKISYEDWIDSIIWFFIEDPWYFTAYFAFLMIVPFVNYMFKKLTKNGVNIAFLVVMIVFILWKLLAMFAGRGLWDSSLGIFGNYGIRDAVTNRGYNVINFLVIYVIVQWLIVHDFFRRFKWYGWTITYLVTFGIQYLMIVWTYSNMLYEYSNPFVILSAISLFGMFYNMKLKKKNEYVNYLSTLTLLIFLLHWNQLGKTFIMYSSADSDLGDMWLSYIMRTLMRQPVVFMTGAWVAEPNLWAVHVLLIFALLATALFMMSLIYDLLSRLITALPPWNAFVNMSKSLLMLERYEVLFVDDQKK
ncbi:hypothetical protein D8X55_02075 [Malacoplasma penetrans]|uniref:acyltransferase n=1 Tax=Malacoplasma penetrans TaxID=28227 RepID=UPI001010D99F|nr:acyltransferase [Malacoplasma penetrans]RXY96933.1 hypothetical protein D8X55_02075 [Malacoplasma penetrans]